jgi:hypothetical protein
LFIVLRPAQELFTHMETSPLPVKGCKIYARRSAPLSRGESLSCYTYCDTGLRFFRLHMKDRPFSRLLRHAWGCGGSILTRILTGGFQTEQEICEFKIISDVKKHDIANCNFINTKHTYRFLFYTGLEDAWEKKLQFFLRKFCTEKILCKPYYQSFEYWIHDLICWMEISM